MLEAQKAGAGADKKKSAADAGGGDARREMTKTKEQLEEEKKIALSIRLKPLELDAMDSDELKAKATEIFNIIIQMETDKYDYEQRKLTQELDLKELKERQKAQLRAKALKKGLDPEALTGKYPPKIRMYSKYERRTDTRSYDDRKCYAYGDELKPHVEFLDGIMLSSTRDIAPSCLENVDELIERQEKSLSQLDSKRNIVTDLIAKGKVILQNPDKPKFLEGHVKRIQDGWEDTKQKAQERLQLLNETRSAFIGYAENSETVANEFDIAEEEIKKVKKIFNLDAANADLSKRQEILKSTDDRINGLFSSINKSYNCMAITIPEDKKKILTKEIKAVEEKLEVLGRFKSTVQVIVDLVNNLTAFDNSLKTIDNWKEAATTELKDIKEASGAMLPEDRVARTMDLQEDIAAKLEILKTCVATEADLLPQGDKVPADAQVFKDELNRIIKYVEELQANTKIECDKYSNDVKYWAEYRTGIKEFSPWLASAEKAATEGLSKPSDLDQVKALNDKVNSFDKTCENYLKVLKAAEGASLKMTTHTEADSEVAALKARFDKVKAVSETWVKKCEVLVKEWVLLDNTVTELNSWVAKDKSAEGENQFSLEKMESTLGELKNIFKQKEKLVEDL